MVVEVLIEEMFGSDRSRPRDYRRAVVIDTRPNDTTNEDTLRSARSSALKKRLTQPTLLEMYGNATNRELSHLVFRHSIESLFQATSLQLRTEPG